MIFARHRRHLLSIDERNLFCTQFQIRLTSERAFCAECNVQLVHSNTEKSVMDWIGAT